MSKKAKIGIGIIVIVIAAVSAVVYFELPVHKVHLKSELVMLGDFTNDRKWDKQDEAVLQDLLQDPFSFSPIDAEKADLNRNGLIDEEDVAMLTHLYRYSDPYVAEKKALESGTIFPRPRELFKYQSATEYVKRPLYALDHAIVRSSPLQFLSKVKLQAVGNAGAYEGQLLAEIYNEGIRFSLAYAGRKDHLTDIEKKYADEKIAHCNELYRRSNYNDLLLNLIALVEDAETLTVQGQAEFVGKVLYFRDHLRDLLVSPLYADFEAGRVSYDKILDRMGALLEQDLSVKLDIRSLTPPRDYLKLENYVERAKWQYYKTRTPKASFEKLVLYAQYDPRYLRAAAMTTRRHDDPQLQNHNLPMVLLFREALRITNGDKKAAVGLLDEAIRIPFGWIKSIPPDKLPKSLALENFLLPGNKEDGSDKSRHWNVFGGISLYKSPEESLVIALRREIKDLKEGNNSVEAMTEFIRDTIANINGIYHVMSIDPKLMQVRNLDSNK